MAKTLGQANAKAIGDGGYSCPFIVSPVIALIGGYPEAQATSRAVVENAIGRIHTWGVASNRWKSPSVEFQSQAVMVCCELTQLSLMRAPLSPGSLSPSSLRTLKKLEADFFSLSPEFIRSQLKTINAWAPDNWHQNKFQEKSMKLCLFLLSALGDVTSFTVMLPI